MSSKFDSEFLLKSVPLSLCVKVFFFCVFFFLVTECIYECILIVVMSIGGRDVLVAWMPVDHIVGRLPAVQEDQAAVATATGQRRATQRSTSTRLE